MAKVHTGGAAHQGVKRAFELYYAVELELSKLSSPYALGIADLAWAKPNSKQLCMDAIAKFIQSRSFAQMDVAAATTLAEAQSVHAERLFEGVADIIVTIGQPKLLFDQPAMDIAEKIAGRILVSEGYRLRNHTDATSEWIAKIHRLGMQADWTTQEGVDLLAVSLKHLMGPLWKPDDRMVEDAFYDARQFARKKKKLPSRLQRELSW